jgi:four helix bundle protein
MRNFKELKVWQKGLDIATASFCLTAGFPSQEKFGLISQTNRCAVSIASNIAEGSSRTSDKDYKRFLEISLGSCFELETQLLIAKKLQYGDEQSIMNLLNLLDEEQKMLMAFIKTLAAHS